MLQKLNMVYESPQPGERNQTLSVPFLQVMFGTHHISLDSLEWQIYIEHHFLPPLCRQCFEPCTREPGGDVFHFGEIDLISAQQRQCRRSVFAGGGGAYIWEKCQPSTCQVA